MHIYIKYTLIEVYFRGSIPSYLFSEAGIGEYHLIFLGTRSYSDLFNDIRINRTPAQMGTGYVHSGFYNALNNTKTAAGLSVIDDLNARGIVTSTHLYGHSLGAAIMFLIAYHQIVAHANTFKKLNAFGCPHFGDASVVSKIYLNYGYVKILSFQTFVRMRFREYQDPVTIVLADFYEGVDHIKIHLRGSNFLTLMSFISNYVIHAYILSYLHPIDKYLNNS